MTRLLIFVAMLASSSSAMARDIHVAPDGSGDGSEASPSALSTAMASAEDGDTVWLHDGDYGDVTLEGEHEMPVIVAAAAGETPRLRTLTLQNAQRLVVRGLSISLSYGETYERSDMVSVHQSAPNNTIEDCEIFSVLDETQADWTAEQWVSLPGSGIGVRAPGVLLQRNRVRNVGYGISIGHDAPNARVLNNLVENFSRDGLRGIGDFGLFEGNTVKNAYDVDDHHDDFFQSWSVGDDGRPGTGVSRGIVLRGNLFIGTEDLDQPHAGAAQGIGCFDGFFEDWVIENNVVIVNHWHGITLLGARNVRIVNNTLLDNRRGERPGPPWIQVGPHKDGTPSEDIVIRNNLTETITLDAESSVEDHNLLFADPATLFVDPANYDLHLRDDAEAIDMGESEMAPETDRDGIPRPQGDAVDLGAYEWHDGSVMPPDAGVPDAGSGEDAGPGEDAGGTDAGDEDAGPGADAGSGSDATVDAPESDGGCSVGSSSAPTVGLMCIALMACAIRRRSH